MAITRATLSHLNLIVPLFDSYRVFYKQASDLAKANEYIKARLERNESIIFLATNKNATEAYGFVQLYPSFSSVHATHTYILNDLFVKENYRKMGYGRSLMKAAEKFALEQGAGSLSLSTAVSNKAGQSLYESEGYLRDDEYLTYYLDLDKKRLELQTSTAPLLQTRLRTLS